MEVHRQTRVEDVVHPEVPHYLEAEVHQILEVAEVETCLVLIEDVVHPEVHLHPEQEIHLIQEAVEVVICLIPAEDAVHHLALREEVEVTHRVLQEQETGTLVAPTLLNADLLLCQKQIEPESLVWEGKLQPEPEEVLEVIDNSVY